MHSAFEMNVIQVYCLAELLAVVRRDDVALRVKQVAFAIAFEDLAKQPAMPVKVCKLRVAQERVERGRAGVFQEIQVGPQTTQTRGFRIAIELLLLFVLT